MRVFSAPSKYHRMNFVAFQGYSLGEQKLSLIEIATSERSMPYLIDTVIPPSRATERNAVRPQHLAYLEANKELLLACGAKLADDGSAGDGSFYLLDVESRADAEAFISRDPYCALGLVASMTLTRVRKGFYNYERV